ncbi:MAG: hypothetical protein M3P08_06995 [Thermoproteota archaeon]|jgi:hypothetical protein|nr:hypothetical protein [Thermoproteota archaeon]
MVLTREEQERLVLDLLNKRTVYFMVKDLDKLKLKSILDYAIVPLVEQYFFGNKEEIEDIVNKWQRLVPDLRSDYSEYKLNK